MPRVRARGGWGGLRDLARGHVCTNMGPVTVLMALVVVRRRFKVVKCGRLLAASLDADDLNPPRPAPTRSTHLTRPLLAFGTRGNVTPQVGREDSRLRRREREPERDAFRNLVAAWERFFILQDQHAPRRRPPAGVVVLLGSRLLSHTTRS